MKIGNIISKVYDANFEVKFSGVISEIDTAKGYIRIYTNDEYKYYNFKFEEKSASQLLTSNRLFLSKKDGKYGFIDANGNVVIDYIYDEATEQNASRICWYKKGWIMGCN